MTRDGLLLLLVPLCLAFLLACTPGEPVEVTIPAGATTAAIADTLRARGVILSPALFRAAARVLGYDRQLRHGHYELRQGAGCLAALEELSRPGRTAVMVTIPEGYTMREVAALLDERDVCPGPDFLAACRDRVLLDSLGLPGRDAEGYLFPDTWEFEPGASASAIVRRMVRRFREVWERERARVAAPPLDDRATVILASIVEREALRADEVRLIAGVFLNRLRQGVPLSSCATVQYVLPAHKEVLTLADTRSESPYNTYLHPGLPPGPICNPGARALAAALDPEPTEYLYFVARGDGSHVFSRTLRDHERARRRISSGR
ncbi:MAG: endolytic transglycosylase MltG [bacterium]